MGRASVIDVFERLASNTRLTEITERLLDTVAFLGKSELDGLRADCRDSDNLVASDMDDLVGAAARRCWVVARNLLGYVGSESKNILIFAE